MYLQQSGLVTGRGVTCLVCRTVFPNQRNWTVISTKFKQYFPADSLEFEFCRLFCKVEMDFFFFFFWCLIQIVEVLKKSD